MSQDTRYPLVTLESYAPLPEGADQYSLEFCEANKAIKLRESTSEVRVGLCDPTDRELRHSLAKFHRKPVVFERLEPEEFASYLGRRLAKEGQADRDTETEEDERILLDQIANDAPIVNFLNSIFIDAIRAGASDIHIEAFSTEATVRYRIDGALVVAQRFPRDRFAAVSTRIKVMANLNIMERRLPQDGRLTVDLGGTSVDMRVSIVSIVRGESIVLRLFGRSNEPLALDDLGMPPESLTRLKRLLKVPHGLILVTGPTGSGKSTTLNSMLRTIKNDALKIITIEDPIEYIIDGIDQIQTNEQIKLTFDSILRRVLRQDPDIVMVGEIRDHATAELVVRAALTGHLVFSTLHTNDSVSSVSRLRNIGVEPYLVASVLRGALAQRLVRRVCPDCVGSRPVSAAERVIMKKWGVQLESLPVAKGCPKCRGTGYAGRFAVFEFFENSEELEDMIARNERMSALYSHLTSAGMKKLAAAGLERVAVGMTTIEELERAVEL